MHIRPEFVPPGGLSRSPTGQSSNRNSVASIDFLEDPTPSRSLKYDSSGSGQRQSSEVSSSARAANNSSDAGGHLPSVATASTKATPSPVATTPTPTPVTPPLVSTSSGGEFGSSLMAELDSFGSLLTSMGYKEPSSSSSSKYGANKATPTSSSSSLSGGSSGPRTSTAPKSTSYLANYEGLCVCVCVCFKIQ